MPGPTPRIDYEGYNPSPNGIADTESPAGRGPKFEVHANPEEFGANIGEALQGVGKAGQQVGSDVSDLALKKAQLQNETASAAAETALIQKNVQAKADFMSTEGTETSLALPKYQKQLQDNYEGIRSTLSGGALRQFDLLGIRQNANYNSEAVSYEATQVKKANMMAHASLINATQDQANNPNLTAGQIGELNGTIAYSHGAMLDENHPGLQQDENGNFSYADTLEGRQLKADNQNAIDYSKGIVWQNAITAKANQNPIAAQKFYQDNKDEIPAVAQTRIEAFLNPKVDDHVANGIVNTAYNMGRQAYQETLLNPPSSTGSFPNNLGNVKTAEGAAKGTQQFVNPATPVDGVITTANNLQDKYQDMTLQQIGQKWTGESAEKVADWVKNASAASGIAPDQKVDLSNPAIMSSLIKGIATAEKSPQDRALFTDQIIGQGVQASYDGKQANLLPPSQDKSYATNADGSRMTDADYFATHREQVLAWGDQMAERDFPGNTTYHSMIRERLTQQMNAAISDQTAQYKQDNQYIVKAINGDLTKGKTPMTYQELRQIPGVGPVLDRVAVQDPKFSDSIDTLISRVSQRADDRNSPNGYGTILRTLEPNDQDHPNRIGNQDHLVSLLGRKDDTGINMKDFNDAKGVIESSQNWKDFLSTNMKAIAGANGNLDGQGETRALNWFNRVNQQYKTASEKDGFDEDSFIKDLDESIHPHQPSRMEQLENWAKSLWTGTANAQPRVPTFSDPSDSGFAALASGSQFMTSDGQIRTKH